MKPSNKFQDLFSQFILNKRKKSAKTLAFLLFFIAFISFASMVGLMVSRVSGTFEPNSYGGNNFYEIAFEMIEMVIFLLFTTIVFLVGGIILISGAFFTIAGMAITAVSHPDTKQVTVPTPDPVNFIQDLYFLIQLEKKKSFLDGEDISKAIAKLLYDNISSADDGHALVLAFQRQYHISLFEAIKSISKSTEKRNEYFFILIHYGVCDQDRYSYLAKK